MGEDGREGACVFCEIASGRAEAYIVYEDEGFLAFLDKRPVNPGHTLVVPRKHYATILDMPPEEVGELFERVAAIAPAVHRAIGADGLNILQTNGRAAWQSVFHVHVHIIPRRFGDSIRLNWPHWSASPSEFEEVRNRIRSELEGDSRARGRAP
ncbi:MAG: HIT family protein [Candidatus Bathyarchaeia archaeon]